MWTGYQAEDAEMVSINSQCADAEAVLLYPAGVDITSIASDSDTHIAADNSTSTVLDVNIRQPLQDVDLCDSTVPQSSVTELPENGECISRISFCCRITKY